MKITSFLVKPELNFYVDRNRDRFPVFLSRVEFPLIHGLDRFLIQTQSQAAGYMDVAGPSIGADNQAKNAYTLIFGLAGFFGVFRIRGEDRLWRAHTAAYLEHAAANSAAAAFTNAGAGANANSATAAGTDSAAGAGAIGRRSGWHSCSGIAEIRGIHCQLDLRGHDHRRLNCQLRMIVSHHDCRRRNLLHCGLGNIPLRRLELIAVSATTTAA